MPLKVNKSQVTGRPTHAIEMKTIGEKKTPVVNFQIAVDDGYWSEKDKKYVERAHFIPLVMWGKKAENFAKLNPKGRVIYFEGKLIANTWEDDGGKNSRMVLEVAAWQFVEPPKKGEPEGEGHISQQTAPGEEKPPF